MIMRMLFLLLLVVMVSVANAQTVSGVAKDDSGTPLNGATVALVKAKDTAVAKLAVAASNGAYSFNDMAQGDYRSPEKGGAHFRQWQHGA